MRKAVWLGLTAIALAAINTPVLAQRGTGDEQGVFRSGVAVETAAISGTVTEVARTTCPATTGRSPIGVHLILQSADGEPINLHLGPPSAMDDVLATVDEGDGITADAFRTDALAPDNYVATTLTVDGQTFTLRGDDLQPVWAGSGGRRGGAMGQRSGQGSGVGGGQGQGLGPCQW